MSSGELRAELSQKTRVLGLKLWVVICIGVFALIVFTLSVLSIWAFRRKTRRTYEKFPLFRIPDVSKEITVDRVGSHTLAMSFHEREGPYFPPHDTFSDKKTLAHTMGKSSEADNLSQCSSVHYVDRAGSSHSGEDGSSGAARRPYSPHALVSASPLVGLPDVSHLGWGHWFTLRDLEYATDRFCKENVIGEGGYGIVYKGRLINGMEVAVKKLLNNM